MTKKRIKITSYVGSSSRSLLYRYEIYNRWLWWIAFPQSAASGFSTPDAALRAAEERLALMRQRDNFKRVEIR